MTSPTEWAHYLSIHENSLSCNVILVEFRYKRKLRTCSYFISALSIVMLSSGTHIYIVMCIPRGARDSEVTNAIFTIVVAVKKRGMTMQSETCCFA